MRKLLIWLIIFLSGSLVFSQSFKPHLLAVMEGEKEGDFFGRTVAGIGDINDDGFGDFAIQGGGKVYIYSGATNIDTIPEFILSFSDPGSQFGYSISKAGDVNGDDTDDFILSIPRANFDRGISYLYLGNMNINFNKNTVFSNNGDLFGATVSYGNFNNDEFDDILISANNKGQIYLYFGGSRIDTISDAVFSEDEEFLNGLPDAEGDINGDSYDDIFISATFKSYIYFGNISIDTISDLLLNEGQKIAVADFNQDGYADFVTSFGGLYYGSETVDNQVDLTFPYLGKMATGFFNRDSYPDLLVGRNRDYGGLGAAYLYLGGNPMDNQYDWGGRGTGGGELGYSVANAGDVNGDGIEDFLIGEPRYYFEKDRGRVFLLSGDTTHLAAVDPNFSELPKQTALHQNYPNPFNATTTISYDIDRSTRVQITIINLLGKEVKTLTQKQHSPGAYQLQWNGKDNFGNEVTSGVYFIVFKTGGLQQIKKLMVIQ